MTFANKAGGGDAPGRAVDTVGIGPSSFSPGRISFSSEASIPLSSRGGNFGLYRFTSDSSIGSLPRVHTDNSPTVYMRRPPMYVSSHVPPMLTLTDRSTPQKAVLGGSQDRAFRPEIIKANLPGQPDLKASELKAPPVVGDRAKIEQQKTAERPGEKPAQQFGAFHSSLGLDSLSAAGIVNDKTAGNQKNPQEKLASGETAQVKVLAGDATGVKPDFVVKADGSIDMLSNPEKSGQKQIVIQVEKPQDGQPAATELQKEQLANIYSYLHSRMEARLDPSSQNLLDKSLLPEDIKKNLDSLPKTKPIDQSPPDPKRMPSPESGLPPQSGRTMQDMENTFRGSPSSNIPSDNIRDYRPPVQRVLGEDDRIGAMKDSVARHVVGDDKKPYEYVTKRGDRGWGVGRYGTTFDQYSNWLLGLSDEAIEEMIKQGKISPAQGAKLKKQRDSVKTAQANGQDGKLNDKDLDPFLAKMKSGEGSEEEMKAAVADNMGKEVQELAASSMIRDYATQIAKRDNPENPDAAKADPGEVALAMVMGRVVPKEEWESKPDFKRFVESGRQAYRMFEKEAFSKLGIIKVENMSDVDKHLEALVGQQLFRSAMAATEYGNKGCMISVAKALQPLGIDIPNYLSVNEGRDWMYKQGWDRAGSLNEAMNSGRLFVLVNKETGSHIGLGRGNRVWENSSGQRQWVSRDIGRSTLKHSGTIFYVPIAEDTKKPS